MSIQELLKQGTKATVLPPPLAAPTVANIEAGGGHLHAVPATQQGQKINPLL